MNTWRLRTFVLAISVAVLLFPSCGSTALGEEQGSQATPILEPIEWTDLWVTNANRDDLPRVLFVGDSITRGYFKSAEKQLDGQANCARYATSAFISHQDFLDGLKILLDRYDFDVIHINNGLHGWDYTEAQYRDGFPALIKLLTEHASGATVIWAMTTPIRQRGAPEKLKEESTERVRQRNRIAAEFAKKNHFGRSELFALVIDHPEYFGSDGVHFNSKGIGVQGRYVAGVVTQALKSRESTTTSPATSADNAAAKRIAAERKIGVRELKNIDPKLPNVFHQLSPGNAKSVKRNRIAAQIMKQAGIPVTDLYSAVVDRLELGGGIHWSKAGYGIMAAEIAKKIEAALRSESEAPQGSG